MRIWTPDYSQPTGEPREAKENGSLAKSQLTFLGSLVERRALLLFPAIPGGQGAERKREGGTVVSRGLSDKARETLATPNERRPAAEVLTRRVRHFTQGVISGSQSLIDRWFESNRQVVQGRSRMESKRGARSLGQPALRGLYALRDVK